MTHATRHLDTAIAILGAGKANRKPSRTVISLYDLGTHGVSVQVNGKEVCMCADMAAARADAARRADSMATLKGYRPEITEY